MGILFLKLQKKEKNEIAQIMDEITQLKQQIKRLYDWFDNENDFYLIDSCTYQLKSMQLRYEYLLRRAKDLSINNSDKIGKVI